LLDAKREFISEWGNLGAAWNISRAMAEIHGLLLVTDTPVSTDDIMDLLKVSRGTVNANVRELMDWGLISKRRMPGDRREYFIAEKDIWKVATLVIAQRRRKELDPLVKLASDLKVDGKDKESKAFTDLLNQIKSFAEYSGKLAEIAVKSDRSWYFTLLCKIFK